MKNYLKPTVSVVELQSKEALAANPFGAVVTTDGDGYVTTTYSMLALNPTSGGSSGAVVKPTRTN